MRGSVGDGWARLRRALAAALAAGLAVHLAFFVFVALARLVYPYELEYIEGGLADEVLAILHGQMPYAAPSVRLVAFVYPPLYFYASAALAWVLGPGLLPLRAVSLLATAALAGLVYALARQAGARRAAAWFAVGLLAASFKVGGSWLSLARVDALFVALLLAGAYLLQRAHDGRGFVLAGVVLALAFFTKQSALTITLPLAVYAVYADRQRGWLLAASFAAVTLALFAWFHWASQGWFDFYVLTGAGSQPFQVDVGLRLLRQYLFVPLAPLLLGVLAFFVLERRAGRPIGFWLALLAGAVGTGAWVMLHLGALENNLLPALAALAVLGGLALDRALTWAAAQPGLARRAAPALVYALCVLQLGLLGYDPLHRLPDNVNRQAGAALAQRLAQTPGDVFLPQHGAIAALAGQPVFAHLAAIDDVLAAGGTPAAALLDELRAALSQRRFALVVVDGPDFARRFPELAQNYQVAETRPAGGGFFSVHGPRTQLEWFYVPR